MTPFMSSVMVAAIAGLTGSGICSLIIFLIQRHDRKSEGEPDRQMLMGLAHDRIYELGERYIRRGWISVDEYDNLSKYLYKPYKDLHGDGTGDKIMQLVDELQIRTDLEGGVIHETRNDTDTASGDRHDS